MGSTATLARSAATFGLRLGLHLRVLGQSRGLTLAITTRAQLWNRTHRLSGTQAQRAEPTEEKQGLERTWTSGYTIAGLQDLCRGAFAHLFRLCHHSLQSRARSCQLEPCSVTARSICPLVRGSQSASRSIERTTKPPRIAQRSSEQLRMPRAMPDEASSAESIQPPCSTAQCLWAYAQSRGSWLTTSAEIPIGAAIHRSSLIMQAGTAQPVEGAGLPVEQQQTRTANQGPRAKARRCCWPPDRRSGYTSLKPDKPARSRNASDQAMARQIPVADALMHLVEPLILLHVKMQPPGCFLFNLVI